MNICSKRRNVETIQTRKTVPLREERTEFDKISLENFTFAAANLSYAVKMNIIASPTLMAKLWEHRTIKHHKLMKVSQKLC